MQLVTTPETRLKLSKALRQMNIALTLLDELDVPGEIGATLDLAIARLEKAIGRGGQETSAVHSLISQLEHELTVAHRGDDLQTNPWEIGPV